MPTREEMIAAIRSRQQAPASAPSREEMIAAIRSRQQAAPEQATTPAAAPEKSQEQNLNEAANAGLQSFGDVGTLGYLPELQAKLGEALGTGSYEDLLKSFRGRAENLAKEHPIATAAGGLAGAVTTAPLIPGGTVGEGASLGAKIARAAGVGAAIGGASNPGDVEDQLQARARNAAIGGLTGGATEGLASKLGDYFARSGQKTSERAVLKQIGANAGQVKKILRKDELPKIEGFIADEGLMAPGTSVENVMEHTKNILDTEGPQIGELYNRAQKNAEQVANTLGENTADVRISGPKLADQVMEKVSAMAKNHPNRDMVLKEMQTSLQPLRDMGENVNIKDLHEFRQGLDQNVDWTQTARERPVMQDAYVDARNVVNDATKKTIKNIDNALGGNQLDLLKKLNDRYSNASTLNNISTQAVGRETSKALMGHGIIGGGVGATAGYLEYKRSHDPLKALAVGLGTATALKAARKYGPSVGYNMGRGMQMLSEPLTAISNRPNAVGAAGAAPWLYMNRGQSGQ